MNRAAAQDTMAHRFTAVLALTGLVACDRSAQVACAVTAADGGSAGLSRAAQQPQAQRDAVILMCGG
jgi:hypothetical protein